MLYTMILHDVIIVRVLFAAECQSLPALADGKLYFTTTGVETIVSIACDVGTSVSGINKLNCNADGSWNASLPTCSTYKFPIVIALVGE